MPALKWLRLLLNHIPDRYEHLVRYYGYYSNRLRGVRRRSDQQDESRSLIAIDGPRVDSRRKASWARLIKKVDEVDPLECPNCGATLRIIALIEDTDVVERILRHLKMWDLLPDLLNPPGPIRHGQTARPCRSPITPSRISPERLVRRLATADRPRSCRRAMPATNIPTKPLRYSMIAIEIPLHPDSQRGWLRFRHTTSLADTIEILVLQRSIQAGCCFCFGETATFPGRYSA